MRELLQQEVMLGNKRQRSVARRNQHVDVSILDQIAECLNELRIFMRQTVRSANRLGTERALSVEEEGYFNGDIDPVEGARNGHRNPRGCAQNQYRIVFRIRVHLTSLNVLFVGLHQFNRCRLIFYSA